MFAVSQWCDAREGCTLSKALFPVGQKGAQRSEKRSPKTPKPAPLPKASSTATLPPKVSSSKEGVGSTKEEREKKRQKLKRRKLRALRRAEGAAAWGEAHDGVGDAEGSTEGAIVRKAARRKRSPVDKKWRPKRNRADRLAARNEVLADSADATADKTTTRKRKKFEISERKPAEDIASTDTAGQCANGRPPRKKAKTTSTEGDAQSGRQGKSGEHSTAGDVEIDQWQKRLTRKQWQNRTKSKRRIRNKYKLRELVWRKESEEPSSTDDRQVESPADAAMHEPSISKYKLKKLKRQKGKEEKQQVDTDSQDPGNPETACDGDAETIVEIKKKKKKKVSKSEPKRHKPESGPEKSDTQEMMRHAAVTTGTKKKLKSSLATKGSFLDDVEDRGPAGENRALEKPSGSPVPPGPVDRSAALRLRMQKRLQGARFRFLNQQLYEGSSRDARALFRADPQAFLEYHQGFVAQVQQWPVNPLSRIIASIKNRPASLVVADFGCGDAQLAASVRNPVHSFDLVALNDRVTACDMAKVPLDGASVDVAVFCLSLMGTNVQDFLTEANRVLRKGGVLMIAEVASRFEDSRNFLGALSALGFKLLSKDLNDSHFHLFELQKIAPPKATEPLPGLALKPCVYKKR